MLDLGLHADMCCGFDLEITAFPVSVEVSRKGALDVTRTRVMPFKEIAVIGVYDADEIGEICRSFRMQCLAEGRRGSGQFCYGIGDRCARFFQPGRFDALNGFENAHWPILQIVSI